jgi:mannose-6-phosphate isomerase
MAEIYRLVNPVQEYAWGSRTAIPRLLRQPFPAEKPQAELWMGAHPKAPSQVILEEGSRLPLPELIARDPRGILGASVAEKFSGSLPFLFKVLAAAQPLSIQAHPDLEQARAGFSRENEMGIALDAFQRNYRDDNHKPEVISALTPFWAMNGFRPISQMLDLLRSVRSAAIRRPLGEFENDPTERGLKAFFAALMKLERQTREQAIAEALRWAGRVVERTNRSKQVERGAAQVVSPKQPIARWVLRLQELYPGDIGVLSPLLLNLILLEPGETMFLEAGVLHAYLEGTGIELMANSDNVIRGGLTPKHIDVPELLSILRFEGRPIDLLSSTRALGGEQLFRAPAEEFCLAKLQVDSGQPRRSPRRESIELMIVVEGRGGIEAGSSLSLQQGDSLMIPASTGGYSIEGSLLLYKAFVPP